MSNLSRQISFVAVAVAVLAGCASHDDRSTSSYDSGNRMASSTVPAVDTDQSNTPMSGSTSMSPSYGTSSENTQVSTMDNRGTDAMPPAATGTATSSDYGSPSSTPTSSSQIVGGSSSSLPSDTTSQSSPSNTAAPITSNSTGTMGSSMSNNAPSSVTSGAMQSDSATPNEYSPRRSARWDRN